MTTPVLLRVQPRLGESLSSITARTAALNGLAGTGEVHARAGVAASRPRSLTEAADIGRICGLLPKMAQVMTPVARSHTVKGVMKTYIGYYGHWVEPDAVIYGISERICPMCLAKNGFQLGVIGLSLVTVCPIHNVRLIDICPSCGANIQVLRPNIRTCRCTFNLATAPAVTAHDDEARVSRLIDSRWRITFDERTSARPTDIPVEFWSLTLTSLLRCLSFLHKSVEPNIKNFKPKNISTIDPRMQLVGEIIANWPNGFYQVIDAKRRRKRSPSEASAATEIQNLSNFLFTTLPEKSFFFLHEAMIQSIKRAAAPRK